MTESMGEYLRERRLRPDMSYAAVGKKFGLSAGEASRLVAKLARERKHKPRAVAHVVCLKSEIGKRAAGLEEPHVFKVPTYVMRHAERRAQMAARRDLTGTLMGDPPPGYSALDKRRGA